MCFLSYTSEVFPKAVVMNKSLHIVSITITLPQVMESIQTKNWSKYLQPFYTIRHQLSVYNKVLLKDHQIEEITTPYAADCTFTAPRNPKDKKSTVPKSVVANTQS